jgi:hypothetical protein
MENKDDFMESVNETARSENNERKGDEPLTTGGEFIRINYEILPIEELRKQGKKLMIKDFNELNKQKLIEAIRNAKNKKSDFHSS